jgi:hypothetical protein
VVPGLVGGRLDRTGEDESIAGRRFSKPSLKSWSRESEPNGDKSGNAQWDFVLRRYSPIGNGPHHPVTWPRVTEASFWRSPGGGQSIFDVFSRNSASFDRGKEDLIEEYYARQFVLIAWAPWLR